MWTTKLMIDGVWRGDVVETAEIITKREAHLHDFRGFVTTYGSSGFEAKAGRYHLYVSYACPFAHRAILVRALKRLEATIDMSVLHPRWNTPDGWSFGDSTMSTIDKAGNGFTHLHQAFSASQADYTGRVTVPILWDRASRRIVSDDSYELMRMLNSAFDGVGGDAAINLWPEEVEPEVEILSREIASEVGIGFYRIGGAEDEARCEEAQDHLFAALARLEARLSDGRCFLHGCSMTASDIVLFTPLIRLDLVYRPLFGANRHSISEYPRLAAWLERMSTDPVAEPTVKIDHICAHYYDGWAPRRRFSDFLHPEPMCDDSAALSLSSSRRCALAVRSRQIGPAGK